MLRSVHPIPSSTRSTARIPAQITVHGRVRCSCSSHMANSRRSRSCSSIRARSIQSATSCTEANGDALVVDEFLADGHRPDLHAPPSCCSHGGRPQFPLCSRRLANSTRCFTRRLSAGQAQCDVSRYTNMKWKPRQVHCKTADYENHEVTEGDTLVRFAEYGDAKLWRPSPCAITSTIRGNAGWPRS